MVILLLVVMVAVLVIADLLIERRRRSARVHETGALHEAADGEEPRWVAGMNLPRGLHYHPAHTWVHWVSPDQAYVGVDDFARRLLGRKSSFRLPPVGAYVRQGEGAIGVERQGRKAELLSPISGEVVAVNPRVARDPGLVGRDSYGQGWLYKIRSPRLVSELSNLLTRTLAERWLEDTRDRFLHRLMLATGSVIQDGGAPVEDIADHLGDDEWESLAREFLSTRPRAM